MQGKVLIVDDESSNRHLISKALKHHGFDFDEADGFESAKDLLEANEYDVVLTDKNMPLPEVGSEGGMELIRWIHLKKPHLPVILITGFPSVDSAVDALKFGAFDYLLKPLDMNLLVQKVDQICQFRKSVNPDAIMHAYLGLSRKLTEVVIDGIGSNNWLAQVQERLSHIFRVFRTVEQTLLEHRQLLAEIEASATSAKEAISEDNPLYSTLVEISKKAAQRF